MEKNQNELNRLEKDGKIDRENFTEENNKIIKKVAKGKKHVDSVEQFVDMNLVMATAMENKVYLNMLEPCLLEGINLTDRIKQYFIDNKVKPFEIDTIFQEEISRIRLNINKEVKGLVFDENGMIDVAKSIQEARQYGVNVAGCVGAIIEEVEGTKFKVGVPSNVFNVTEIVSSKDDVFYENLFINTQRKLQEFSANHNIDIILGEAKEDESQTYRIFRNKFKNIQDSISKKLAKNRSGIQKVEDVLKAYYEYQQLLSLDVNSLEGITEDKKAELLHVLEELKDIFRDRFKQELGDPDFGELREEEVLERIPDIDQSRIRQIKEEIEEEISKERFDGKSDFSDIRISDYERSKASKISRINLFKSLTRESETRLIGTFSDEFKKSRYYDYDIGKYDNDFFKMVSENDDRIIKEAEDIYNQDQFIDIYSEIISRYYMKERLDKFSYAKDSKNPLELSKELDDMCIAINAAWIMDEYTPMGERIEADIEFKKLSMQILKEIFPEAVFARGSEVDGLNESFDAAIVVSKFKERYKGIDEVDSIQTIEDLIQFTSVKSNIFVKSKFYEAMTFDDSEEANEMNELLDSPETLEEVRKKHEIHKKIIVKEKRLTQLSSEIIELTNKVNNNTISVEEELALVEKCVIVLKEYNTDAKYGLNVLNKIARENLALYLPNLFKNNNVGIKMNLDNLDSVYRKFLHERGIDVNPGENPIEQAIERNDRAIEEEILQDVVKRNAAQESRKIKNQNIEKLEELDELDDQERILKFLRFAKKTIKNEKDEDINVSSDKIESIENTVKGKIKEILVRSGKSEVEEEKIYKNIDELVFDEGMYYSMMREIRIGYANSFAKEFSKEYSRKDVVDNEDAKKIISLYLGIKRDIKNSLFNKMNFMTRQQLLINLMKKIDPKLVEGVRDVDEKALLQKYNELFGENFEDIDEAYAVEEKRILEEVIDNLEEEVQNDNGNVMQQPILNAIRSDTLLINSNLQRARLKEEHIKVNNTLTLVKEVQALLSQRLERGLSKDEEIKLVNTLALMVGILKDEPRHKYEELTDAEEKFEDLRTDALAIAYDNIAYYFPEVMNKGGNIKEFDFENAYRKYLEENGQELPAGVIEGKSILTAVVEEFDHKMEHYQDQELRINIEDATRNLMAEIDSTLKGFEEEKNETIYLNVIQTLRKLLETNGHKNFEKSLKKRFDEFMPGLFDLALQTEDKFLIDNQYIDSLLVVAGKREMEEINNQYFPRGEKGRKHTKIEDISIGEQTRIVQIAIGTIVACEEFSDYKVATKTDTKKKAVNLLSKFFDDVLDENGNLNKEAVLEQYREKLMSKYSIKYESFEDIAKRSHKRLALKAAGDIVRDDKINSQYVSLFKDNALRYEIFRNNEELELTDGEINSIMQKKSETVIVGDVSEIEIQNNSDVEHTISASEIENGIEDLYEEIDVDGTPKVSQAESTITNGFELEEINVQSESEPVFDNHPVKVSKQNIFAKALGVFGKFVKEKIVEIKNNIFGENADATSSDSSNNSSTTTSSSSGTEKKSQIGQDNNMFGPQVVLDLKAASESMGKNIEVSRDENLIDEK